MAATRIMSLHIGKGRTVGKSIQDIIDYVENPDKTDGGRLISSYQCDSRIANAEFLFAKRQYLAKTGRKRGADMADAPYPPGCSVTYGQGRVLFAGEIAEFLNPMGEGISAGMESGYCVAQAIANHFDALNMIYRLPLDLLHHARMEWSVESMHWLLDVHFGKDFCRV